MTRHRSDYGDGALKLTNRRFSRGAAADAETKPRSRGIECTPALSPQLPKALMSSTPVPQGNTNRARLSHNRPDRV
jgi:hypothetical protein